MFIEWGFLLTEIWVLLALAALVGLIAGWLIWGGRKSDGFHADEMRRLRAELDRARAQARASSGDPTNDVPPMQGGGYQRPKPPAKSPALQPQPAADAPTAQPTPPEGPQPFEPAEPGKPQGLDAPRNGLPDDLTKIKGIGPKMEKLCNGLGFWHYDQIANWTADEIAWVDNNLEGFKGRVTRDNWVAQAKALAPIDTPAFSRRRD